MLAGAARNTSTCVEKTRCCTSSMTARRKHLHVRGEDPAVVHRQKPDAETPPHAWRRLSNLVLVKLLFGNTSTCVEKTPALSAQYPAAQKHLHVRGEDLRFALLHYLFIETPPRAWRRLGGDKLTGNISGNTSTCVEKTTSCCANQDTTKKHLHVRGEDAS